MELTDAITSLVDAMTERDKAYEGCDQDPDYFCSAEDEHVTVAETRLMELLASFVDERVEAKIAEMKADDAWNRSMD